jgi:trehalose 6-phosphate synthase
MGHSYRTARSPLDQLPNFRLHPAAGLADLWLVPVGGLVSAVRSSFGDHEGLWVGWNGRTGEGSERPEESAIGSVKLAGIDLSRSEVNLFYNTFCNRTLWPLLHGFPLKATFRQDAYRSYRRVNEKFANALIGRLCKDDLLWVHDFHLIPLAHELRSMGGDGKIGFFLHTPFPASEVFSMLPWARPLLSSKLE